MVGWRENADADANTMAGPLFRWTILLMVLVAGAAEGAAAEEEGLVFSPEIEALLSEDSDPEAYGTQERCIRAQQIRHTEVLDDRHIVFELPSKTYYLVQFEHSCHRLRRGGAILYEPRGSQLCRMDYIRAADNLSMGDIGPPCSIPGFYEVKVEQVALLRETLKARRKAQIDAFEAEKAQKKKAKQEKAVAGDADVEG